MGTPWAHYGHTSGHTLESTVPTVPTPYIQVGTLIWAHMYQRLTRKCAQGSEKVGTPWAQSKPKCAHCAQIYILRILEKWAHLDTRLPTPNFVGVLTPPQGTRPRGFVMAFPSRSIGARRHPRLAVLRSQFSLVTASLLSQGYLQEINVEQTKARYDLNRADVAMGVGPSPLSVTVLTNDLGGHLCNR